MCTMCGCGMSGNNGDMQSPDSPMMVVSDIFSGSMDSHNQQMQSSSNAMIVQTPDVPDRTGMESVGNVN